MPKKTVAAVPPPKPAKGLPLARITKRVDRETSEEKRAKEQAKAGTYRVIHGSLIVPKSAEEIALHPEAPKTEQAIVGDEIWLNDMDAMRAMDADLVEPLDAKPSRLGKVWTPPRTIRNHAAMGG